MTNMQTDVFGNLIEVGDLVAFNRPRYKHLIIGKVIKVSEKQVRISYTLDNKQRETSEYASNCAKKPIVIGHPLDYHQRKLGMQEAAKEFDRGNT